MKFLRWPLLCLLACLCACQPQARAAVTILDGNQVYLLQTAERLPSTVLAQAQVPLAAHDLILADGRPVAPDRALPAAPAVTLQVIRAVRLTVNGKSLETAAATVGEALVQAGARIYAVDALDPPVDAAVRAGLKVTFSPSRPITIGVDGGQTAGRASASDIGSALAQAGFALIGLDESQPAADGQIPPDGRLSVTRVRESLSLSFQSIPFTSQTVDAPDVDLGTQKVLQAGQPGLAIARTRIRYADGQVLSRQIESASSVVPPQSRVVATGSRIVLNSLTVNGVAVQYWRAVQMYATVYSPCNSGGTQQCYSGTSSGLPAGKGVVAVDPSIYSSIVGQRLYIPGYGFAVVGDIGGGYIIENKLGISRTRWIDLGFNDNNIVDMTGWVTVYFLAPAPASIPGFLK